MTRTILVKTEKGYVAVNPATIRFITQNGTGAKIHFSADHWLNTNDSPGVVVNMIEQTNTK